MSSMRNAVQRRNHKERAQPIERGRWGLLEKHKDYSLRAKDYNVKKTKLKSLRSKAAERNPDEFYHGMLSSTSRKGKKVVSRGNQVLSDDTVQLLKTQDLGYLRTMIQRTRKQIARLKEEILLSSISEPLDDLPTVNKSLFVPDKISQQEIVASSAFTHSPDYRSDASLQEGKLPVHTFSPHQQKKIKDRWEAKVAALQKREKELRVAESDLENQRAMMNNTVGGANSKGVQFKIRSRKK